MDNFNLPFGTLGAVTATLLLLWVVVKSTRDPLAGVPGPWYAKWTGFVMRLQDLRGTYPLYVHNLHLKYGPVVRISPYAVDSANPDDARIIYQIKGEFKKSPWYGLSNGEINVFNVRDVDLHRRYRKALSHPLSESSLKAVLPQVEAKVRLAIQRIGEEVESRGVADVYKWWMSMTTDVIGQLAFGESFRTLDKGEKSQYVRDIEASGAVGAVLGAFPILDKIPRFLLPPTIKNIVEPGDRLQKSGEHLLQRYKARMEADPSAQPTLFTRIIQARDDNTMTSDEIRDNAKLYIIAGSDTTSTTLTYLTYSVCRQPAIRDRLVEELKGLPEGFGFNDLKDLPYLNNVIAESLRLYSAVPAGLPRTVPPGGTTMSGHPLPEGTTVQAQAYTLHRNPSCFPEADKFDPDRWAEPTKEMKDSYQPFGAGSRICIGLHLAYHELRMGAALFFLKFPKAVVSKRDGMSDEDMETVNHFLMSPKGHRCLIQPS